MHFKNKMPNWDDLRLFHAVAQAGGLASAVGVAGASVPTLSRRMKHLENTLCVTIFERHRSGYTLTAHGRDLLDKVTNMAAGAKSIQTWREELDHRFLVRIAAGAWTSAFLARHLEYLSAGDDNIRIELLTGANFLNLSRQEADIGIRNKSPDQQGLARKLIGPVDFAIYGSKAYCKSHPEAFTDKRYGACNWAALSVSGGTGSSSH